MSEHRDDWLHDLFDELDVPTSHRRAAARACMAWWQTEGGATYGKPWHGAETDWNPFNTTRREPGSHDQPDNDVPVQVYADRASGMKATADTLRQSDKAKILKRLVTDGFSAYDIARAIYSSNWGTGALIFDVLDDIVKRGYYDDYDLVVYPS